MQSGSWIQTKSALNAEIKDLTKERDDLAKAVKALEKDCAKKFSEVQSIIPESKGQARTNH